MSYKPKSWIYWVIMIYNTPFRKPTSKSICQKNLRPFLIVKVATFVKIVIMKPFLGYIPDSKKKDEFLDAFLDVLERSGQSWWLDFMLLSIFARR